MVMMMVLMQVVVVAMVAAAAAVVVVVVMVMLLMLMKSLAMAVLAAVHCPETFFKRKESGEIRWNFAPLAARWDHREQWRRHEEQYR